MRDPRDRVIEQLMEALRVVATETECGDQNWPLPIDRIRTSQAARAALTFAMEQLK